MFEEFIEQLILRLDLEFETYLKSSISGVRSCDSLDESQKAADPETLTGALLPMEVPTAAKFSYYKLINNNDYVI